MNNNQIQKSTSGYIKFPTTFPANNNQNTVPYKAKAVPTFKPNIKNIKAVNARKVSPGPFDGLGFGSGQREDFQKRVEMIKEIYIEIMGKEPEQRDLNYYRFSPVDEKQLREELISSKEHKDLVDKGNKYNDLKEQLETQKARVKVLESQIKDQIQEFDQLHNLLNEKNRYIRELRENKSKSVDNSFIQNIDKPLEKPDLKVSEEPVKTTNSVLPEQNNVPPEPPIPHFTDSNEFKKVKKNKIFDKIFRS